MKGYQPFEVYCTSALGYRQQITVWLTDLWQGSSTPTRRYEINL